MPCEKPNVIKLKESLKKLYPISSARYIYIYIYIYISAESCWVMSISMSLQLIYLKHLLFSACKSTHINITHNLQTCL